MDVDGVRTCAYGMFDFDELDAAETSDFNRTRQEQGAVATTPENFETSVVPQCVLPDVVLCDAPPQKRMSKARAWFEIRRFFNAEPQKYYKSCHADEWKTYYAKELVLKAMLDKLQRDGFVVLDALLAPKHFHRLAERLLADAPEQIAALQDHLLSSSEPAQYAGSVICYPLGMQHVPLEVSSSKQAAIVGGKSAPIKPSCESEPVSDKTLCSSCLVALAHDRISTSVLRPRSMQQFFDFFQSILHEVSASSMSPVHISKDEKIPVQFCFGNIPAPKGALLGPPKPHSIMN